MITKTDQLRKGWRQYPSNTVARWDDFVNWEKRQQGEGAFFVDVLRRNNVKTVLDIACGTGYDSIRLVKEGFTVTSSDGSAEMLAQARANARKERISLNLIQSDWRNLIDTFKSEQFDAIICLGNSFTHLFSEKDRQSVMNQIYYLLKKGGVLIIDQRNYDSILKYGYSSKHKYVYCGNTIDVSVVHKDEQLITFRYTKQGNGYFELNLYPIKVGEMTKLIKQAGYEQVTTYGDFEKEFNPRSTDFIQHVAVK
ncbi:class I SAM-dependent methyltransferase [Candidatus Woesearchaeota archaeon]|nr:class I SAM-dependent methyltransferase [Candidatus Woesearchaeota archaeon]